MALKQHVITILRLQKELERSSQETVSLESDLSSTGSTKTADDVQAELDILSGELYVLICRSPIPLMPRTGA